MVIDHIGIMVRDIEKGRIHWEDTFGYRAITEVVINTRQKVKVQFLQKKDSITIKLIEPWDHSSPDPSSNMRGIGLHHLCFKCNNLRDSLEKLKSKGLRVLTPPEPGEAFENEPIAFLYGKQGLNIELIDTDKRALLIK